MSFAFSTRQIHCSLMYLSFHSGTLVLNVPPSTVSPLISVKWHPLSNETLAVTSESRVYLIDLVNTHSLGSQPFPQGDLHHISQVFEVPSVS